MSAGDADARVSAALAFLARPDRRHSFGDWIRMLLEDMLVIDAATIYPRFDRAGRLYSLDIVDGATIKPLIGEDGRAPEPPDPAYQQVLHGVPAADFTHEELLYLPRNPRAHRLYGFSPVEQIALTVNIALRRDAATLDYYRTGSSPDAFATLPKEWTADQIRQFQDYFDALMSGNSPRRRQMKFMPADFQLIETRQPPLKDQYDEWLARVICYAFSVPVSPFVAQVNRASGETMRMQATQEGLIPLKGWIKAALDHVLQVVLREPELEFTWVGDDAVDPLQQAQTLQILVSAGIKTREEARAELGLGGDVAAKAAELGKFNPHHDERGRFSAADASGVGHPARKPRPKGVQVASNDAVASDTVRDGQPNATSEDLTVSGPENRPSPEMSIVHETPDDAKLVSAGDGTQFYAPPYANFAEVYRHGQAHWQNPFEALDAIWHFGRYDYQRDNDVIYSAYTDASNYAVCVYMAGAGYSRDATVVVGRLSAELFSSNASANTQAPWWTRGWDDATNGKGPFKRSHDD